jgi:DNA-binding PadR family transcriptional regulator
MYVYDMKKRSMQEPTFLILTALAAGPQHGYGIITDAERISGGVTRLQTGTLYMALDRLRAARLVEPDREEVAGGRLRRYYRLTDEGAALLGAAAAAPAARRRHRVSAAGTGQAAGAGGDMPVRDPAGAAVLERRYRRLLRCYPPTHREFHREEMLGVLLAAARPGQRAPGLGQTVNLAACGLVIRVRRIPGWLAADAGQDALAVVSLIAPAVVVILLALGRGAMDATAAARVPFWTLLPVLPSLGESVVVLAWLAVVLLGLTGCRGAAAVIAAISLTLAWLAVLTASVQQSGDLSQGLFQFLGTVDVPVVLASLAACSLALSPGPLRGLAIVGWRRACLMIAGLSAGFGFPSIVQLVYPAAPSGDLAFRLLGVLAIALAVAVTRVRSPAGRRVAGLVATGLLPSLAVTLPYPLYGGLAAWLVILVVAVLVWPVAIVSWRGRVRRASRAG